DGALAAFLPFQGRSTIGGSFSGAQLGYNWQNGSTVWGLELSGSAADIYGPTKCATNNFVCDAKYHWLAMATARVGYAAGHILYYAKAGGAAVHEKLFINTGPLNPDTFNFSDKTTRSGWVGGAGVEYAFTPTLLVFAEYNYIGLGTRSSSFASP